MITNIIDLLKLNCVDNYHLSKKKYWSPDPTKSVFLLRFYMFYKSKKIDPFIFKK